MKRTAPQQRFQPLRPQNLLLFLICLCLITLVAGTAPTAAAALVLCSSGENDLYQVLCANGVATERYDRAVSAVEAASPGSGVLILADGYPGATTEIPDAVFERAVEKHLRLYVEYPSALPELIAGEPRRTKYERAVVASDIFGKSLAPLRVLAIHDCHFVPYESDASHIVAARVAGFDTAVFGLENTETFPILFEHPNGNALVSTTKLSQFVTARYAPKDAWQAIWQVILNWVQPDGALPLLDWETTVGPTYGRDEELPPDAVKKAVARGIDWHTTARLLPHESWKEKYHEFRKLLKVDPNNPVAQRPDPQWPSGDGEWGLLEGVSSNIQHDGYQPIRWWFRSDSIGESSLAFALRSRLDGDERSRRVAANLLDWLYFKSGLFQNDREKPNYGLLHWAWDSLSLYGDNDVKAILGCMGTAALLDTAQWDEVLLADILANFRTTGIYGYRGRALNDTELLSRGWQHYWRAETIHYAPHYQAWIWATYLWLYDKTGYEPLLERTRNAIRMMMEAYPDNWRWTNGIQQERGRMLLTLAWLIRVDDRPEYRTWLRTIAEDMQKCQDACGGIREELGELEKGGYRPPQSNDEYGLHEASLIQENGDPVADMLYTCNFTFLGLHEAYAATGEAQYREMADRLADFLVRIQVRSERHPELDGGWFRAFDYERWDYWGSNADAGWGAWSIEVGWTQAWIPTVLSMRELDLNLWEMTQESRIGDHWEKYRQIMLPEEELKLPEPGPPEPR